MYLYFKDVTIYNVLSSFSLELKEEGIVVISVDNSKDLLLSLIGKKKIDSGKIEMSDRASYLLSFSDNLFFENSVLKEVMVSSNKEKAKYYLEKVGLDASFFSRSPFTLSSGEKRKLMLASILSEERDILILLNPLEHLDHESKREILKTLSSLKNKLIVILSDNISSFASLNPRVIEIKGSVVLDTNTEGYYSLYPEKKDNIFILSEKLKEKKIIENTTSNEDELINRLCHPTQSR